MSIFGIYLLIGIILVMTSIGIYFEHRVDKDDYEKNRR